MLQKIKKVFKSLGPGFIIMAVVLGSGSITVASRIGSEHGYAFLWVIVLAAVFMVIYSSMGVRFWFHFNQHYGLFHVFRNNRFY